MKIKYKLRSIFEEFKLKLRVLWSGVCSPFTGDITPVGRLYITKISADGTEEDLGLVCTKVVTDAGVAFIVDAFQNLTEVETMKFHASGTGSTAEAVTDTTLVTEAATRVSGTTGEGASANIYQTVAVIPYTGTLSIVEHGVLSATAAGVLLDRSVFAAVNVISGDSIQFTYELTFPSGS